MTTYRVTFSLTWECEAADEWDAENVAAEEINAAISTGDYRIEVCDMAAVVEEVTA
jgi:hypothetical protein